MMAKKRIEWSLIDTDRKKLRKNLSMGDMMEEFKRLLLLYFKKRVLLSRELTAQNRRRNNYVPTLFGDYTIEGTNIVGHKGRSHRGCGHSRKKIMSLDQFLIVKHKKEQILEGIRVLRDFEPLFELLEDKGTAQDVTRINNATLRTEALHYYGIERFFKEMNAQLIHQEGKQQLLKLQWHKSEEAMMMVKVIDSTTRTIYLLRVPPDMQTVSQAVAWTFDMSKEEYRPIKET